VYWQQVSVHLQISTAKEQLESLVAWDKLLREKDVEGMLARKAAALRVIIKLEEFTAREVRAFRLFRHGAPQRKQPAEDRKMYLYI